MMIPAGIVIVAGDRRALVRGALSQHGWTHIDVVLLRREPRPLHRGVGVDADRGPFCSTCRCCSAIRFRGRCSCSRPPSPGWRRAAAGPIGDGAFASGRCLVVDPGDRRRSSRSRRQAGSLHLSDRSGGGRARRVAIARARSSQPAASRALGIRGTVAIMGVLVVIAGAGVLLPVPGRRRASTRSTASAVDRRRSRSAGGVPRILAAARAARARRSLADRAGARSR